MGTAKNPFAVAMTQLTIPAHMGRSINVGGFELEADDDGTVEVPTTQVPALKAHGLVDYTPKTSGKVGTITGSNLK